MLSAWQLTNGRRLALRLDGGLLCNYHSVNILAPSVFACAFFNCVE